MDDNDVTPDMGAQNGQAQAAEPNPNTHRMIQGRDMTYVIPRSREGVPLTEFFGNAHMPDDLHKAMVHKTENGYVLAPRDPVAWNQGHDAKASEYASALKSQIEEKGYYRKTMTLYAERLSKETGQPVDEMKAVISRNFQAETGKDPYTYLQEQRQAQGLPTQQSAPKQQQNRTWGR